MGTNRFDFLKYEYLLRHTQLFFSFRTSHYSKRWVRERINVETLLWETLVPNPLYHIAVRQLWGFI